MKITMYELLGMVKDEPDRSIYVKYFDRINKKEDVMWACKENIIYKLEQLVIELNDKVEILEEENKKCTVETCCMGIEGLSKSLLKIKDDMKSIYKNINKVETLEEKKIPEKIPEEIIVGKKQPTHRIKKIEKKINEIISYLDYLKSKGE